MNSAGKWLADSDDKGKRDILKASVYGKEKTNIPKWVKYIRLHVSEYKAKAKPKLLISRIVFKRLRIHSETLTGRSKKRTNFSKIRK